MNITAKDLPQYSDYKESFIAFIDILGFNDKIKNITNSTEFFDVGKLLYTIKETANSYNSSEGIFSNFKIIAISDSVIITVPYNDQIAANGLFQILQAIQYQLLALDYKTTIRGYVNKGLVYHKGGLIFGEGYNQAYSCEKKIGGPPRIVISPEIIEYAKTAISQYSGSDKMVTVFDFLKKDNGDGYYFIDYLKQTGLQSLISKEQFTDEIKSIEIFIKKSLRKFKDNSKVYSKYKWLEKYYYQSLNGDE